MAYGRLCIMVECESVVCWVGERIDMFGEREERLSETLCDGGKW